MNVLESTAAERLYNCILYLQCPIDTCVLILFMITPYFIKSTYVNLLLELAENVFLSKSAGTGPLSYKKILYFGVS